MIGKGSFKTITDVGQAAEFNERMRVIRNLEAQLRNAAPGSEKSRNIINERRKLMEETFRILSIS